MIKLRNIIVFSGVFIISFLTSNAQPTGSTGQPRLVVPVGHSEVIMDEVQSPDGKLLASFSNDHTVKIWSLENGKLLQTLYGHKSLVTKAQFSDDNQYISTLSSYDSTIRVWNINSGKELCRTVCYHHSMMPASFSLKSTSFLLPYDEGIVLLSLPSIDTIRRFRTQSIKKKYRRFECYLFSPDNKFLITSNNKTYDSMRLWNIGTGKIVRTISPEAIQINYLLYTGDKKTLIAWSGDRLLRFDVNTWKMIGEHISRAAFDFLSHDGKSLFSVEIAGNEPIDSVMDAEGRLSLRTRKGDSVKYYIRKINLDTKKGTRIGESYSSDEFKDFVFDPAGKFVVLVKRHEILVMGIDGSILKEKIHLSESKNKIASYYSNFYGATPQLTKDGRYILLHLPEHSLGLFNLEGKLVLRIGGNIYYNYAADFDKKGEIISSGDSTVMESWNILSGRFTPDTIKHPVDERGEELASLAYHARYDKSTNKWNVRHDGNAIELRNYMDSTMKVIGISPDKKSLVTHGSNDSLITIWNIESGQAVHQFKNNYSVSYNVLFNAAGTLLAIPPTIFPTAEELEEMWDKLYGEMDNDPAVNLALYGDPSGDPKDSTNKTNVPKKPVFFSYTVNVIDPATGKLVYQVSDSCLAGERHHYYESFLGSTRHFALFNKKTRVWDTDTWDEILSLPKTATSLSFDKFNKKVLVTDNYTCSMYETKTNKLIYKLPDAVSYVSLSENGKFVLSCSPDRQFRISDSQTGKTLYTYYAFEDNDYLVLDEFGRYDGTEKARKALYYVCGKEIIDLDQFKQLGWQPGLAGKIMGSDNEPITAKKISEINICNVTPLVEEKGMSKGNYQYLITPRSGGLGEVQLFIKVGDNEKLIRRYDPTTLAKVGKNFLLSINQELVKDFLVSGSVNGLSVKATTKDGTMTSRGGVVSVVGEAKATKNPDVYLVSIGISQYKGDKLKLAYASKDAIDFASALTLSAKKLLNTDGKEHVSAYTFSTNEGSQYWPAKQAIAKTLDSISQKATADDIFILFFAGHGVLMSGQKNLYLLTADATAFEMQGVEKDVAISFDELKTWMQKIKANKQLVILDACNSGQVIQNLKQLFTKRDVPADQLRALEDLKDKTGTYILSASASGQSAYETSLYGQGLLTYSLLSGIKLGDGLKDNKYIDVTKWFNTAAGNVKTMAQDIGGRQDPQIIGNASFNVGLVDKEVTDEIKLSIKKKVFRRSTLVKEGPLPSDNLLGLSALVDKALNEVSSRGKESPLTYIPDNTLLDAYSIVGNYKVEGNEVIVKLYLLKGEQEDKPLFQTELKGTIDKKNELALKIVEEVQKFLNQ